MPSANKAGPSGACVPRIFGGSSRHAAKAGGFLILALLTSGCAHRPEPIRVPVACVTAEQVPAEVPLVGILPEDARQAADVLGLVVLSLRENERIMRALLSGCLR